MFPFNDTIILYKGQRGPHLQQGVGRGSTREMEATKCGVHKPMVLQPIHFLNKSERLR